MPEFYERPLGPGARAIFTVRGTGAEAASYRRAQDCGVAEAGGGSVKADNYAAHVGDDPAAVGRRRRHLAHALGLSSGGDIAWMNQIHSATVAPARRSAGLADVPTADALIVDRADPVCDGVEAAAVLVADCVPLLLASGDGRLLAAVHAGRRGMLAGIVGRTIGQMVERGATPDDLHAIIGPSICGRCYEVEAYMRDESAQQEASCACTTRWGTPGIDVAAGVRAQLHRAGVSAIMESLWCTYEDERWHSYRRNNQCGRLAGIVLPRLFVSGRP